MKPIASKSGITCQAGHPGIPEKQLHVQHTNAFAAAKTDETIKQANTIRLDRFAGDKELVSETMKAGVALVVVEFI